MITIIIGVSRVIDYKMGECLLIFHHFLNGTAVIISKFQERALYSLVKKMMTADGVILVSSNLITAPMTGRLFFLNTKTG